MEYTANGTFFLPLLLDGATGTALLAAGMPGSAAPGLWCLEHPQVLQELQRAYAAAGSRVVLAPTFGMDRVSLARHGVEAGEVPGLNRRLLALSRETVGQEARVAADLSPLGLFLPPAGETAFEELVDLYREQAAALTEADLFVIETTMTLAEARAAVLAVREVSEKPIFVTFTCDEGGRTLSGTDVLAAQAVMEGMGVSAFGLNCSFGPEAMLPQLRRLGRGSRVPLIAKPNAGVGETCGPEELAAWALPFAQAGVRVFGGCCGSTPAHIAALRAALEGIDFATLPAGAGEEGLLCASEREARRLPADVDAGPVLDCSEDLAEDILDAEEDSAGVVTVRFRGTEDFSALEEGQYALRSVLGVWADDPAVLEGVLRRHQGRALWVGGQVPPAFLAEMVKKYGLVVR